MFCDHIGLNGHIYIYIHIYMLDRSKIGSPCGCAKFVTAYNMKTL